MPYEITYRLSNHFLFESEENTAELVVKAINICYDEGKKIFEKCETLKEFLDEYGSEVIDMLGDISIEKAAAMAEISVDEFREYLENKE